MELRCGSGVAPSCAAGGWRSCCSAYWPAWPPVWPRGDRRRRPHRERLRPHAHPTARGGRGASSRARSGFSDADLSQLDQIPEVAAWAGFSGAPAPSRARRPATPRRSWRSDRGGSTPSSGPRCWPAGRPDPRRDDEAVVNEAAFKEAAAEGFGLGSTVTWRSLSPAESDAFGLDGPPSDFDWTTAHGPVVTLHLVGVIRIPAESVVSFASNPLLLSGPGWATAHLASAHPPTGLPPPRVNALVRLRHGAADVPAFKAAVARVFGRDDIPVKDLADDVKRVQRSLDVERTALLLFAAAVVLAAAVLPARPSCAGPGLARSRCRCCGRWG